MLILLANLHRLTVMPRGFSCRVAGELVSGIDRGRVVSAVGGVGGVGGCEENGVSTSSDVGADGGRIETLRIYTSR